MRAKQKIVDGATVDIELLEELFGSDHVFKAERLMGAEDFAYYSHKVPACFYRLGVGNISKGISSGVHTPKFNIDENAIETGMGMMAWLAVSVDI